MTVENLHDAIGQLPGDLIAETDRRRSAPGKIILWQRYAAMAACVGMLLCASWFFSLLMAPKGASDMAAAEAEMMMQDLTGAENQSAPAEAAPMAPMEAPAEAEAGEEEIPTFAAMEDSTAASGGHSHAPSREERDIAQESIGWCPPVDMTATIFMGDEILKLEWNQATALADILYFLPYSEESLCRCIPEFTVDIETEHLYEVSLSQYFVRYNGKQAALTEEQAEQMEEILNGLEIDN